MPRPVAPSITPAAVPPVTSAPSGSLPGSRESASAPGVASGPIGKPRAQYAGPERRRHALYVTRNTEYHLRDGVCVAVKNRRNDHWLLQHEALNQRLAGGVRFHPDGIAVPVVDGPKIGEALHFQHGASSLVTSLLCGVDRPEKRVVQQYSSVGVG